MARTCSRQGRSASARFSDHRVQTWRGEVCRLFKVLHDPLWTVRSENTVEVHLEAKREAGRTIAPSDARPGAQVQLRGGALPRPVERLRLAAVGRGRQPDVPCGHMTGGPHLCESSLHATHTRQSPGRVSSRITSRKARTAAYTHSDTDVSRRLLYTYIIRGRGNGGSRAMPRARDT